MYNKIKLYLATVADVPNANGIIYPKDILAKAIKDYNEKSLKMGVTGYSKGNGMSLPVENTSFIMSNIIEENDKYYSEIDVLEETPEGKKLKELINENFTENYRLCSMSMANVFDLDDGTKIIGDDLIISYFVIEPKDKVE